MEREYSMKRFGMGVLAAGLVLSLAVPVLAGPGCSKSKVRTTTMNELGSQPVADAALIDAAVERVMASMPRMTYQVGDMATPCAQTAAAKAAKSGAPMHYVVAGDTFACREKAMDRLAELMQAELPKMARVAHVVDGESMTCARSAAKLASDKGCGVKHMVAGVEFGCAKSAKTVADRLTAKLAESKGCAKTFAAKALGTASSGCCAKSAKTASADSGCSKSKAAKTAAAKSDGCCNKAKTAAASGCDKSKSGCSKSKAAQTVAAKQGGCCAKKKTAEAKTAAAKASGCCSKSKDAAVAKSGGCSKSKEAAVASAKAAGCAKSGCSKSKEAAVASAKSGACAKSGTKEGCCPPGQCARNASKNVAEADGSEDTPKLANAKLLVREIVEYVAASRAS
jgi:hypothetical protein